MKTCTHGLPILYDSSPRLPLFAQAAGYNTTAHWEI